MCTCADLIVDQIEGADRIGHDDEDDHRGDAHHAFEGGLQQIDGQRPEIGSQQQ